MANKEIKIAIIEPVGGHGGMDYYDYGLGLGLTKNNCSVRLYTEEEKQIAYTYPGVIANPKIKSIIENKSVFSTLVGGFF